MTFDVYCHTSKVDGRRYIGYARYGIFARWKEHVHDAFVGSTQLFHSAIREFGPDAFYHDVICIAMTLDEAKLLERHYIEMLATWGPDGFNMNKGGTGSGGWHHSKEVIERLRSVAFSRSDELKRKQGEALRGKKRTPDQNARISQATKNGMNNAATRQKIRAKALEREARKRQLTGKASG